MLKALTIFSGNANRDLAQAICRYVETPLGKAEVTRFADGEVYVEINENVRGVNCFVVQPTCAPANDNLMELLVMIDALRRASAGSIIACIPYFGYARQDRKSKPRTPISARLVADLITAAGVDRVVSIDLHAGQIQGFFNIPVDELSSQAIISRYFVDKQLADWVVVAPDLGAAKRARNFAERIGASLAVIEKRRPSNAGQSEILNVIGEVAGHRAIVYDDEIDTAGSVVSAARVLEQAGVQEIYAACTHGVLSGPAIERLKASTIQEVVITDTVPLPPAKRLPKITVLSVAPNFAEAIQRIHSGVSVGALFR